MSTYTCDTCFHDFKRQWNLDRHIKKSKGECKPPPIIDFKDREICELKAKLEKVRKKKNFLKEKVDTLEDINLKLSTENQQLKQKIINFENGANNINQELIRAEIHKKLVNPDWSYLLNSDFCQKLGKNPESNKYDTLKHFCVFVYGHPKYPQNHFLKPYNNQNQLVFNGKGFTPRPGSKIFEKVLLTSFRNFCKIIAIKFPKEAAKIEQKTSYYREFSINEMEKASETIISTIWKNISHLNNSQLNFEGKEDVKS